ncbi:MAG: 1-acyl-sn-glycerol-3-phosphate acyltransferase [Deltaproteobacteria bacterium]|nr:1-acyl-sn-glycerol-3-phosphate acyltransferase [Deltaproteobacteria bacterium]
MRAQDRERALHAVQSRVIRRALAGDLEGLLADAVFVEQQRVHELPEGEERDANIAFWQRVRRALASSSREEREAVLADVVARYARAMAGNLDDRLFGFARKVVPPAMALLLGTSSPKLLVRGFRRDLEAIVTVDGETEALRRISRLGSVMVAPTHQSNLDSVLVGWALARLGLPPFLYAAASNLFEVPVFGRIMKNMGAYRVDRNRTDQLYTGVLREYATVSLELGYTNLVFPGGARSRSGAIDPHTQLDLLGTGLSAYQNCLAARAARRVFVVPCVLSYRLVLEAEWLIEDYLKGEGRSRYLITEDELPQPRRLMDFAANALSLDARIYVTFGAPLDPFGNPVDSEGRSVDPRGRPVDTELYVARDGVLDQDAQRDGEYTRELGEALRRAQLRGNVIYSTHVLARAAMNLFRRRHPGLDLYMLLRACGREPLLDLGLVYGEVDRIMGELGPLAGSGALRIDPSVARSSAEELVRDALRTFVSYHSRPAVRRAGAELVAAAPNLLLYYSNRLEGYPLHV